jgi:flagellin-like protein
MRPYRRRRDDKAVSSIIATVILLGITIVLVALLATFQLNLNAPPPKLWYIIQGNQTEQAWGDPTDCTNTTVYAHCNSLPAVFATVTGISPTFLALSTLALTFICNGTTLLSAPLPALEVIPGTGASPPPGSPVIGKCGTWDWGTGHGSSGTYFNRLLYYQQVHAGSPSVSQGDVLVVYSHPKNAFCDYNGYCPDDDYHGAPLWCSSVPNACTVYLKYQSGPTTQLLMSFSLYQFGG